MRLVALLPVLLMTALAAAAPPRVQVLASAEGEPYATTARLLAAALSADGIAVERQVLDGSWRAAADATVIVALGTRAAETAVAATPRRPVLAALLPRHAWERIHATAPGPGAALWLDQPPERQLRLLRLLVPQARRVGAVFGAATHDDRARFEHAARTVGIGLRARALLANDDPALALGALLDDSDAVIAVPDPQVWNRVTAQPLLLATFRAGRPVVAASPSFVRAGAIGAVHTSPEQTAQELAEIIGRLDAEAPRLPASRAPRRFEVVTNPEVARALGLQLPAAETLTTRLRAAEDAP